MEHPVFVVALHDATANAVTGIQPCVAITKGLDSAARKGGAPFLVELHLIYSSSGQVVHVRSTIPVRDYNVAGAFNARAVMLETTVKVQDDGSAVPPADEKTTFLASARLVLGTPQGNEEVAAPKHTVGPVGAAEVLPG